MLNSVQRSVLVTVLLMLQEAREEVPPHCLHSPVTDWDTQTRYTHTDTCTGAQTSHGSCICCLIKIRAEPAEKTDQTLRQQSASCCRPEEDVAGKEEHRHFIVTGKRALSKLNLLPRAGLYAARLCLANTAEES